MKNKNKKDYGHITGTERKEIKFYLDKKHSRRKISGILGRSPNSISREIKKNSINGVYDPDKADNKAKNKRRNSKYQGMKIVSDKNLWNYIEEKLRKHWSPENISGRIKEKDKYIKYISAKGIYKFIYSNYGGGLTRFLHYKGKERKSNNNKKDKLKDRVFIDERPKIIDNRRRFGDWEGDFIVSGKNGQGVILTLYERKSKYCILKKFPIQNIKEIHQYIYETAGGIVMRSLTLDNDIVFKKHKILSELLGRPIYFCHPYHSWEKGGVENINKLVRRFIPKSSDISKYSDEYIEIVQNTLNNKPRECLKYKTPLEVMTENNQFIKNKKITISDIIKVENKLKIRKAECPT